MLTRVFFRPVTVTHCKPYSATNLYEVCKKYRICWKLIFLIRSQKTCPPKPNYPTIIPGAHRLVLHRQTPEFITKSSYTHACCCSTIRQESSRVHQLCLHFSLTCLKQSRGRTLRDMTLLLPSRTRRTTRAGAPRPPPKSSRYVHAQVSPPRQNIVTTFPACLRHRETIRSRCSLRKIKV